LVTPLPPVLRSFWSIFSSNRAPNISAGPSGSSCRRLCPSGGACQIAVVKKDLDDLIVFYFYFLRAEL
jgi:hypothetical protein